MQDFIGRFCSKLKLSENDVSEINKIVQKCIELGVENENTPPSMAAGCIFLYLKKNQKTIQ